MPPPTEWFRAGFPSLANELISLKPDVLVGTPAIGAVILKWKTRRHPDLSSN
jgi:hypothetical protein